MYTWFISNSFTLQYEKWHQINSNDTKPDTSLSEYIRLLINTSSTQLIKAALKDIQINTGIITNAMYMKFFAIPYLIESYWNYKNDNKKS